MNVAERVVGHQPLGHDPVVEEEVQRAAGQPGDGGGLLVVVDPAVGQPATVIDDRAHELPADAARALGAIAGDGMAGLLEAPEALGVHVQQLAGTRPFKADDSRALGCRATPQPARCSARCTVECARAMSGSSASRRGLQPVRRRSSQIRVASSAGTCAGEDIGRLERSSKEPAEGVLVAWGDTLKGRKVVLGSPSAAAKATRAGWTSGATSSITACARRPWSSLTGARPVLS